MDFLQMKMIQRLLLRFPFHWYFFSLIFHRYLREKYLACKFSTFMSELLNCRRYGNLNFLLWELENTKVLQGFHHIGLVEEEHLGGALSTLLLNRQLKKKTDSYMALIDYSLLYSIVKILLEFHEREFKFSLEFLPLCHVSPPSCSSAWTRY